MPTFYKFYNLTAQEIVAFIEKANQDKTFNKILLFSHCNDIEADLSLEFVHDTKIIFTNCFFKDFKIEAKQLQIHNSVFSCCDVSNTDELIIRRSHIQDLVTTNVKKASFTSTTITQYANFAYRINLVCYYSSINSSTRVDYESISIQDSNVNFMYTFNLVTSKNENIFYNLLTKQGLHENDKFAFKDGKIIFDNGYCPPEKEEFLKTIIELIKH